MRKLALFTILLLFSICVFGQIGRQRQNRFNRQPQTQPNPNQIAHMEKKAAENQAEYIRDFLSTLEADDFQKEIAKQSLNEFYEKIKEFAKIPFESSVKRKDAFDYFKSEHFKELKTIISESDSKKLDDFLDGKFDKKDSEKKKKKRRKKKKNKEENDN
ncbi:hypothetical protein ACFQ1Q_01515 [Winogradskyella litorisediminis]|uniref:Uncharacterized protein n=1 Tax=Winogradskyella litorisediminis TaxID=1156618 RepID=A0ABW3N2I3_9FLAO